MLWKIKMAKLLVDISQNQFWVVVFILRGASPFSSLFLCPWPMQKKLELWQGYMLRLGKLRIKKKKKETHATRKELMFSVVSWYFAVFWHIQFTTMYHTNKIEVFSGVKFALLQQLVILFCTSHFMWVKNPIFHLKILNGSTFKTLKTLDIDF